MAGFAQPNGGQYFNAIITCAAFNQPNTDAKIASFYIHLKQLLCFIMSLCRCEMIS